MAEREQLLSEFIAWTNRHITGDEKGQAQIFLDRLFRAFGQKGSLDFGGTTEMRIRKASEDGGGTSFADYVWKPVVLIEMKKRGADLSKLGELVDRSLEAVDREIETTSPERFPRSISLFQLVLAVLFRDRIVSRRLHRYWPVVTDELRLLFPEIKDLESTFRIDG